jgi:anti-sigma factor ChrR (cupin superfamily)
MASSRHPKEALVLHALEPDSPLAPEVRTHLAGCPSCAAAAADLRRAAALLLLHAQAPAEAPAWVLAALRTAMTGPKRLERFVAQVAAFLDIDEAAAQALLTRADTSEDWLTADGISVLSVPTGPRAADALATLCRIQPGSGLDEHLHEAPEDTLVLEGGFRDTAGHELWPGDALTMPAGSRHALTALPGVPCLCLVLARVP